eukprot:m.25830 g.25830  ORF g.25830 m.25830 type:complete len:718 (+) comp15181_c0_seq2:313-2466(+)
MLSNCVFGSLLVTFVCGSPTNSSCPSTTSVLYRSDGKERCVCRSQTYCQGPQCIRGMFKGVKLEGFPPSCIQCACLRSSAPQDRPTDGVVESPKLTTLSWPPAPTDEVLSTASLIGEARVAPSGRLTDPVNLRSAPPEKLKRRKCAQNALYDVLGFDYNEAYFIMGCNTPALTDFDAWVENTGCGTEPFEGTLIYHTAWTGPLDKYRVEFAALLDSWLMTQDTANSEFYFWFMDTVPPANDELINRYEKLGEGKIKFRKVDLHMLAEGTCLENKHGYLNATVPENWKDLRVMGPKEKADLTRILLLNHFGGIWLDTDDVLLRDLRPMYEFAGEFATRLTMSFYFNNNVLGIRKQSELSQGLVEIVCALPYSRDTGNYCRVVGEYCYPKWYWNHGVFQIAERNNLGAVAYPMSFTDPAYGCYPPMLLSGSGGQEIRNWELDEVLELIRGAFVLHTRGYNARKPLHPKSNFAKLYALAKEGAEKKDPTPIALIPTKARTPQEQEKYESIYARMKPTHVEPPFQPPPPWKLIQLQTVQDEELCLFAERSAGSYGKLSTAEAVTKCANEDELKTLSNPFPKYYERHTWQWHYESGYIRPAIREPGRVYCLDSEPIGLNIHVSEYHGSPMVNVCNPTRGGQKWEFRELSSQNDGKTQVMTFYNAFADQCLSLGGETAIDPKANKKLQPSSRVVHMKSCDDRDVTQHWKRNQFLNATHGFKLR